MRESVTEHALNRAVQTLAVEGAVSLERRRAELDYDKLQEISLQYQIPITGSVDQGVYYKSVELEFEVEFFNAPEQRDSPLTMPHFSYGAVISGTSENLNNPYGAIILTAVVSDWTTDERDATVGAVVTIGAVAPDGPCDYEGYVHMTFQGYGAPSENIAELDVGT